MPTKLSPSKSRTEINSSHRRINRMTQDPNGVVPRHYASLSKRHPKPTDGKTSTQELLQTDKEELRLSNSKKISAKDKLSCFREIFKQSLKQCEALRTTMIEDTSPNRVRSSSLVEPMRVGTEPTHSFVEGHPTMVDNLISNRVRAITSMNHESLSRNSVVGPLSICETEAIRKKVETLIAEYVSQNERWTTSNLTGSGRLEASPRVDYLSSSSQAKPVTTKQEPKPNPTIRFESQRLEHKELKAVRKPRKEQTDKTQKPPRALPTSSPSPKPERFLGLQEQSLRQLSLLLQSGGPTTSQQLSPEPIMERSTDSPTQIMERKTQEDQQFHSHRSESRKSKGGHSGKTVQVMPCARKKLASVQQSRAQSKETTKGADNFLSPQPSIIQTEMEWQVGKRGTADSKPNNLLSPEQHPRLFLDSSNPVKRDSKLQHSLRPERRSYESRRRPEKLTVSEVDVPQNLLLGSKNSLIPPKQTQEQKPEQQESEQIRQDLSMENLKSALRRISQEKRNPFRRLKSSDAKARRLTLLASVSNMDENSLKDNTSSNPRPKRIRGLTMLEPAGKPRNTSLQHKIGESEPEWFEENSSRLAGAEPVSIKIAVDSNRNLIPTNQDSNPILRARNYFEDRRIDTVSEEKSATKMSQKLATKILGLRNYRNSQPAPQNLSLSKKGQTQPRRSKLKTETLKSGNLISMSKNMVLDDSQVQDPNPRVRKPPVAVMLYKSMPKVEDNPVFEIKRTQEVRQSTPLEQPRKTLQYTKSREQLAVERDRRKRIVTLPAASAYQDSKLQPEKTKEIMLSTAPEVKIQLARALVSVRDSVSTPKMLEETIPSHLLKQTGLTSSRGPKSQRPVGSPRNLFVPGTSGLKDLIVDGKLIGKGSYATVKTGYHVPSKMEVAIKIYDKLKMVDPRRRANLMHELQNLSDMEHPSIIKLFTKIEDATKIYLIMEFGGCCHLKDFVKGRKEGWLSPAEVRGVFVKIVQGVQHIHSKNVVHRDLKLQNIVLKSLDSPKIVDFGFSRKGLYSHFDESCGTPNYMAPELLSSKRKSMAVYADIWALGVILYYLLMKKYPFKGRSEAELFANIKSGKPDLRGIPNSAAGDLLGQLLHPDQQQRPLCAEILSHPWLKGT